MKIFRCLTRGPSQSSRVRGSLLKFQLGIEAGGFPGANCEGIFWGQEWARKCLCLFQAVLGVECQLSYGSGALPRYENAFRFANCG